MGAKTTTSGARRSARVTLAQVAERAGVSRSAASFVLTGRTDQRLSQETAERVKAAAKELGYRPNLTAKALRTGRTGTVALVSDFLSSTSLANAMVRGVMEGLRQRDTLLFTVDTQGDADVERRLINNLLDRQVDGFIYASMFTRQVELPSLLSTSHVVLLNCVTADPTGFSCIVPDEVRGGYNAARMLIDAGHRQIGFVGTFPEGVTGGKQWRGWAPLALVDRLAGIRQACEEEGIDISAYYTVENWDIAAGRIAGEQIVRGEIPTALICVNDEVAVGVLRVLKREGIRVPEDISLVSFDGLSLIHI